MGTKSDSATMRDAVVNALAIWRSASDAEQFDAIWPVLWQAGKEGPGAFDIATGFVSHEDLAKRAVGALLCGVCAATHEHFRKPAAEILLARAGIEQFGDVRWSIIWALGFTESAAAMPFLIECSHDENLDTRIQAAFSLARCQWNDNHTAEGVSALIALTQDEDADVRDIATFGLGSQIQADSEEIREALGRRLFDTDEDARTEAIVGLARRHDPRAIAAVDHGLVHNPHAPLYLLAAELLESATH